MISRARLHTGAALLTILLLSCGGDTTEDRIKDLISEAEENAEARNVRNLRSLISDQYADNKGKTKDDIVGILRYHFFRNESVHLLTRVHSITVNGEKEATAVLFTAMAGFPIPTVAELAAVRADLYRFDLDFRKEEDGLWRVVRGEWRPSVLEDFRPSQSGGE